MSETNRAKYHWLTKLSIIGGSALISAFGSAFISLAILAALYAGDGMVFGILFGFPIGFLVGGGMAMWLLGKQISVWKVIVVSMLVAFLTSSLVAVGYQLIDWSRLDLHIDFL